MNTEFDKAVVDARYVVSPVGRIQLDFKVQLYLSNETKALSTSVRPVRTFPSKISCIYPGKVKNMLFRRRDTAMTFSSRVQQYSRSTSPFLILKSKSALVQLLRRKKSRWVVRYTRDVISMEARAIKNASNGKGGDAATTTSSELHIPPVAVMILVAAEMVAMSVMVTVTTVMKFRSKRRYWINAFTGDMLQFNVPEMTETIHQYCLPEKGTLEEVINGWEVIRNGVIVKIVEVHHGYVVFAELHNEHRPRFY